MPMKEQMPSFKGWNIDMGDYSSPGPELPKNQSGISLTAVKVYVSAGAILILIMALVLAGLQ